MDERRRWRARWWAMVIGLVALVAGALVPELVHGDDVPDEPARTTTSPTSP